MRNKSVYLSLLFAAVAFAMSACSGNKSESAENHEGHEGHEGMGHASGGGENLEAGDPQFQVEEKFQNQLGAVFTSYVDLKEALVASDAQAAKAKAVATQASLSDVDMKLLEGAAHNDWMAYVEPMQKSLNDISSADDIEKQRESFSTLSDNLYKSAKAFGLGGKEAYYEYCPMAFNDEGAYWLSNEKQIRNPYFGDKMMTCGQVKEKLK